MSKDYISRQATISAIVGMTTMSVEELANAGDKESFDWIKGLSDSLIKIINLPSAQPEIIRCKDCVHSDTFPEGADNDMPLKCLDIRYGGVMPDWYCEHAERRTDAAD